MTKKEFINHTAAVMGTMMGLDINGDYASLFDCKECSTSRAFDRKLNRSRKHNTNRKKGRG